MRKYGIYKYEKLFHFYYRLCNVFVEKKTRTYQKNGYLNFYGYFLKFKKKNHLNQSNGDD